MRWNDNEPTGRFADPLYSLPAAAVALAGEWAAMTLLWRERTAWAAALHLAVCLALAGWLRFAAARGADTRLPALLAAVTPVTGPLGPAGTLVTWVLGNWYSRTAAPFDEWYEALFPTEESSEGREILGLVKGINQLTDGQTNVMPLNDVLSFGTFAQKQAAVTLITKYYKPSFAPVLKKALADPANAIRVQAATAMAKIEAEFLEKMMRLSREAAAAPGDPARLRALAAHYDDYAFSGVLDARREAETRVEAVNTYKELLRLEPDDGTARAAVGRLLVRQRRFSEAAEWYGSAPPGSWPAAARLWHMECLFALERFAEVRALAGLAREDGAVAPGAAMAVELWAEARP